jgi:hypothetical protein
MVPTAEAFAVTLGFLAEDQAMKSTTIKYRNQLTKQTRMSYHRATSLLLADGFSLRLNLMPYKEVSFQALTDVLLS